MKINNRDEGLISKIRKAVENRTTFKLPPFKNFVLGVPKEKQKLYRSTPIVSARSETIHEEDVACPDIHHSENNDSMKSIN